MPRRRLHAAPHAGEMDTALVPLGIATTMQLLALGWTRWQIDDAVAHGRLERLRHGWFAIDAGHDARAAVIAGGCVSCFSALREHGVWVPEHVGREHVRIAEHRRRPGRVGCRPHGRVTSVRAALDDVATSLRCAARCGTAEDLVVVMDSMVHLRIATLDELTSWLASAPARIRALVAIVDGAAESGTESMVRLRLRAMRLTARSQVWLAHDMRVDLLVGDRLVIECDSVEHHTDREAYERDRARDRRLVSQGYIVLRITYRQVHDDWATIAQEILAIVHSGRHRDLGISKPAGA